MNTINGVNSSEVIVGAQDEENTIIARAGNDRVYGGQLADNLGGGADIDGIWGLSGDDVIESKLTTGRPFFDQVVRAAATYRMDLEPTLADRYQLNRVLDGAYEIEDDELVADLIVDRQ